MSLTRIIAIAAVAGIAAYQVPKLAPDLVERLTQQAAAPVQQPSGPAQIIQVTPPPEPALSPLSPVSRPAEGPKVRKVAGGNVSGTGGVTIPAGAGGHYFAQVRINGALVDVMVDTGATAVAISKTTASRLAISPSPEDFIVPIDTANGRVGAAVVKLQEVRLGSISVRDVKAFVLPDQALGTDLLGMSFLGRLRISVDNNEMVLRQ